MRVSKMADQYNWRKVISINSDKLLDRWVERVTHVVEAAVVAISAFAKSCQNTSNWLRDQYVTPENCVLPRCSLEDDANQMCA